MVSLSGRTLLLGYYLLLKLMMMVRSELGASKYASRLIIGLRKVIIKICQYNNHPNVGVEKVSMLRHVSSGLLYLRQPTKFDT
jgi:hypothetical protein